MGKAHHPSSFDDDQDDWEFGGNGEAAPWGDTVFGIGAADAARLESFRDRDTEGRKGSRRRTTPRRDRGGWGSYPQG